MRRIAIAVAFLLAWAAPGRAARDIEFNVDFFCGWGEYYRPMEWTPVEVGITADVKEPFAGTFTMAARQDGLNTLNISHPFVLTPDRPLSAPLVTKFAFAADRCTLTIRDEKGRTRWRQSINLWDFSQQNRVLRVVQQQDLLIGLIGQSQFGLLRLPDQALCQAAQGQGKVYLGSKLPRLAPWDWTGYASLDLLILCDVDWTLLRPEQSRAIGEWISNGGTALVILGQHPLPADGPLARLLPFRIEGPTQVSIPRQDLVDWGLDADRPQTVTAWPLYPKPGALIDPGTPLPSGGRLSGRGSAGFGRVAVLGFSPSQLGEEQAGRSASFWTRQIAACCHPPTATAANSLATDGRRIFLEDESPQLAAQRRTGFNPNDNLFRISAAQNASNQVMEFLYQLEQMRPLSIWWIVLTLMALAVLLGPVDYFVLKRLNKLPYTWLTSTGWIVIFTVGAYFGVQYLRAGAMEVRGVTVLDGIKGSVMVDGRSEKSEGGGASENQTSNIKNQTFPESPACAWATHYAGLFAPRSSDYRLAGLLPNQWWSGIAPVRQDLWSYQRDSAVQQIHCLQVDGGNLPVSLPVNMWTVQPLLSEWALDRLPFDATVDRREGEATVEIRNTSGCAIQRGYLVLQDACADLGSVPAHANERFEVRTRPFRPWQQNSQRSGPTYRGQMPMMVYGGDIPRYPGPLAGPADQVILAQGCLSRTLAMHTALESGAVIVCVVFENAPLPIEVKDRTYKVNHIQIGRLLVPPEIKDQESRIKITDRNSKIPSAQPIPQF